MAAVFNCKVCKKKKFWMKSKKNFKEKQYSRLCFKCLDYLIDKERASIRHTWYSIIDIKN